MLVGPSISFLPAALQLVVFPQRFATDLALKLN